MAPGASPAEHPANPVLWLSEVPGGYHNPEGRIKMAALEAAGHPVTTVHPIGGASLNPRKAVAVLRHLAGLLRGRPSSGVAGEIPFADWRLAISPVRHGRFTGPLNVRLVERRMRRIIGAAGAPHPIIWFRFPSPELVALIGRMGEALVVYDLIDYVANRDLGRRGARATREAERALIRRADLVLASSERSLERVRPMARHAVFHPHGVDADAFAGPHRVPADLAGLPRPLIGYTGGDDWADLELLESIATRFSPASLVVVGPWGDHRRVRRLAAHPNVHLLGPRPHTEIPAYMAALDVALLPYRSCVHIEYSAPVKVCEYLAVGAACVATDVPYLRRFADVIAVTRDRAAYLSAVEAALAGRAPGDSASRRRVAQEHAWSIRNAELVRLVHEALARRTAERRAVIPQHAQVGVR